METELLKSELNFKAVRSSGAGGQHVNKVSTKVVLELDLIASKALTKNEKDTLKVALGPRLKRGRFLRISSDRTRSQAQNRAIAEERLIRLLAEKLEKPKLRKATRPTKASVEKRLKTKKQASEKKTRRQKPDID